MMVISNFTAIRKQNGADDHSLIVLLISAEMTLKPFAKTGRTAPTPREGDVLRTSRIARIQQMLIS